MKVCSRVVCVYIYTHMHTHLYVCIRMYVSICHLSIYADKARATLLILTAEQCSVAHMEHFHVCFTSSFSLFQIVFFFTFLFSFFIWYWDLNSESCICLVGALTLEPRPQPFLL
jgi:hypothetical protein